VKQTRNIFGVFVYTRDKKNASKSNNSYRSGFNFDNFRKYSFHFKKNNPGDCNIDQSYEQNKNVNNIADSFCFQCVAIDV
jgi:hypothetical protein